VPAFVLATAAAFLVSRLPMEDAMVDP